MLHQWRTQKLSGAWTKYTPMHREFALPHSGGGQLTAILFLRTGICMELTHATLAATKVWRREPGPVPRVAGPWVRRCVAHNIPTHFYLLIFQHSFICFVVCIVLLNLLS